MPLVVVVGGDFFISQNQTNHFKRGVIIYGTQLYESHSHWLCGPIFVWQPEYVAQKYVSEDQQRFSHLGPVNIRQGFLLWKGNKPSTLGVMFNWEQAIEAFQALLMQSEEAQAQYCLF